MACSLEDIKNDSMAVVRNMVKGDAKTVSFTKRGDALITPSLNSKKVKTQTQAYNMALEKVEKINKWSKEKFNTDAYTGQWTSITQSPSDVRIQLTFPKGLESDYKKKIAVDEARRIQQEDAERSGAVYSDDYLFDYLPPSEDGFQFGLYLEKKKNMRNYFSTRISVLENMANKDKAIFQQISEYKEVVKKLNKDIKILNDETSQLSNFFNYFTNDLNLIKDVLLNNKTMDNLLSARIVLDQLNFIKEYNSDQSMLDNPVYFSNTEIDKLPDEQKQMFNDFIKELSVVETSLSNAETTFLNDGLNKELSDDSKERAEQISNFAKNFLPIDGSSDASPIMKFVRKTYDDAVGKSETYTLRSSLENEKKNTEEKLKKEGKTFDIFKRKTNNNGNRLAGKYNDEWISFKNEILSKFSFIQELQYKSNKDAEDYEKIREKREALFDKMNGNVEFIDVTRLPELKNNPELQGSFGSFFLDDTEANKYREELITLIQGEGNNRESAERIYNKIVDEQLENIYSFEVDMGRNLQRLLKKEGVTSINDLSETASNQYYQVYYTNSPFAFSDNYRITGTSNVKKIYFNNGNQAIGNDTSTLEYQSYLPKSQKYVDKDFESEIENDPDYYKAWELFNTGSRYINKNRKYKGRFGEETQEDALLYEKDAYKENVHDILSMAKHYTKKTIDRIKSVISTTRYKDPEKASLSSGVVSIDEKIRNEMSPKIKVMRNMGFSMNEVVSIGSLTKEQLDYLESISNHKIPSSFVVSELLEDISRDKVLASQQDNLFDSLSSQLEVVEKFKAKKEIENKLLFLQNMINDKSKKRADQTNNAQLVMNFIDANLYNINNRANWGVNDKTKTGFPLFKHSEKETIKEVNNAISQIKALMKDMTDTDQLAKAQKDIDALIKFKESKGEVITVGSIVEAIGIKIPILAGLGFNIPSQIGNLFMGNLSGRQNDGLEWTSGNFIVADSYTRKWKIARRKLSPKERNNYKLTNTLIDGLGIFQNSANEIHEVKESNIKNTALKYASNPLHIVGDMEKNIQRPQILAKLGDVTITDKNGNKVPAFNVADTSNPHPAFKLVDGVLRLNDEFDTPENRDTWINRNSQEYVDIFGESGIIPRTIARINGDYRDSSKMGIKNNTLGAMFIMFKTWMPAFIQRRYGRKNGVISGLINSDRTAEAITLQTMAASMFFLTGATYYLSPLMTAFGTAAYMGYRKHMQYTNDDLKYLAALKQDISDTKLKMSFMVKPFQLGAGVAGKLVQQSSNLLTGKQLISDDSISKLAGMTQKEGESDNDFELNKARLHFLLTEASTTATLLMLKALVNAMLFPDEEEEKTYKELDGFYEKSFGQPKTALYYFAENMLTRFSTDLNFLNDGLSVLDILKIGQVEKGTTLEEAIAFQFKEGDYTRGKNKGKNRIFVKGAEYFIPRGLTDLSLGFGKTSQEDYDPKDPINKVFMSDIDKYEKERQKQRFERKEELEEEMDNRYPNKDKEYKDKKIQKKLLKEFPTIKKYFNEDGTIKEWKKDKVKQYE